MIFAREEKRGSGPLFAFIDLLFLMVAFFVLMLFFLQQQRTVAEAELEQTQQQLETVQAEKSIVERVLEEIEPFVGDITTLRQRAEERRRAEEARQLRKRQKETFKLEYEVLPGNVVLYEGTRYSVERFAAEVVERLRENNWIAFRALARPDTPFGEVIGARRLVLDRQQEFDTYWDNLAPNRPAR
jgi:biopolymer transport protein ExbD